MTRSARSLGAALLLAAPAGAAEPGDSPSIRVPGGPALTIGLNPPSATLDGLPVNLFGSVPDQDVDLLLLQCHVSAGSDGTVHCGPDAGTTPTPTPTPVPTTHPHTHPHARASVRDAGTDRAAGDGTGGASRAHG